MRGFTQLEFQNFSKVSIHFKSSEAWVYFSSPADYFLGYSEIDFSSMRFKKLIFYILKKNPCLFNFSLIIWLFSEKHFLLKNIFWPKIILNISYFLKHISDSKKNHCAIRMMKARFPLIWEDRHFKSNKNGLIFKSMPKKPDFLNSIFNKYLVQFESTLKKKLSSERF